jgi:hypothetical protein
LFVENAKDLTFCDCIQPRPIEDSGILLNSTPTTNGQDSLWLTNRGLLLGLDTLGEAGICDNFARALFNLGWNLSSQVTGFNDNSDHFSAQLLFSSLRKSSL